MSKTTPVLETVRRLMARAEHADTPPAEAEIALAQAQRLMTRHAIDEAVLRATQSESEKRKPVIEKWNWASAYTEFGPTLRTMLSVIADTNRCKVVISISAPYEVTVVGMKEDVDWVQILYTNCYLTFISKVQPRWDKDKSIDENVYNFKVAGYKWGDIWIEMAKAMDAEYDTEWKRGSLVPILSWYRDDDYYTRQGLPCNPPPKDGGWLIRAYKRHAKVVGDDNPVETQRHGAYRRSFAEGFSSKIQRRLAEMKRASQEEVASSGQELVLADSWEDVLKAFYEEFPDMHPDAIRQRSLVEMEKSRAMLRKQQELREAMLAGMTPKQRADFLEKEERRAAREYRSSEKYWEEQDRKNRVDHSGAYAGARAAESVRLTRGGTPVNTESRKGINQ